MTPKYRCPFCGHEWTSKKTSGKPVSCPRCKRYFTDKHPIIDLREEGRAVYG